MEFNHLSYEKGQTIAAIATPPGEGGIAIIRIAGDHALKIADRIFSGPIPKYASHTIHFGKILDIEGNGIDEGLAVVMKHPHSYTGEDTVELHCHGGVLITKKVLEATLQAGARAALPGEFTLKAFQNGKIDLTKAEAVQQIIASKSEIACQIAKNHLEGKLYQIISEFQKDLTDMTAVLEAWVDFPEEELEFSTKEELSLRLLALQDKMSVLYRNFYDGSALQTGFSLCLIGAPNVGKSSLMNTLSGKKRAIVTHIPGTTRDVVEEELQIAGLNFRLMDTAGIHETNEIIEKEGIRRSEKAAKEADIVLIVYDITNPIHISLDLPNKKVIAIWNKIDLPHQDKEHLPYSHIVKISAKEGKGIQQLKEEIHKVVQENGLPSKEEVILTSERHRQAIKNAMRALKPVYEGLQTELSPEFLLSDLRLTLKELGTIIGINITEEILSSIFSKFCVGK